MEKVGSIDIKCTTSMRETHPQ